MIFPWFEISGPGWRSFWSIDYDTVYSVLFGICWEAQGLLISPGSVLSSIRASCVSLEIVTGTLETRARVSPSISNPLFCFPLFSTFSLCTLPVCVILGISEALRVVAASLKIPRVVLFTANLFIQKFHGKTFLKREPLFTERLPWARPCAQNFAFIISWELPPGEERKKEREREKDVPTLQWKKLKLGEVESAARRPSAREGPRCSGAQLEACAPRPVLPVVWPQVHFESESSRCVAGRPRLFLAAETCLGYEGFF